MQSQIQKQETTTCTSKSCLFDIPYDLVNNVEDDLDEMWKILDDRYGSTSKLTESIMQDIKRTKPIKEDGEKFVEKFADLVQRAHHDVAHIKVEHELSKCTIISL